MSQCRQVFESNLNFIGNEITVCVRMCVFNCMLTRNFRLETCSFLSPTFSVEIGRGGNRQERAQPVDCYTSRASMNVHVIKKKFCVCYRNVDMNQDIQCVMMMITMIELSWAFLSSV